MGAYLSNISSRISDAALQKAWAHVLGDRTQERCGLIVNNEVFCRENVHRYPDKAFQLDDVGMELLQAHHAERPVVFHSHVQPDQGNWSSQDIISARAWDTAILMLHIPSSGVLFFDPRAQRPYEGREWNAFTDNCATLIADFMEREMGVRLPHWVPLSEAPWQEEGWDEYRENIRRWGWQQIASGGEEPDGGYRKGDLLLMHLGNSAAPNHGAVVADPTANLILHHLLGRLSCIEPFDMRFRSVMYGSYRHPLAKQVNCPVTKPPGGVQ